MSEATTPEPVIPPATVITSTADLIPAGVLGYAKGFAVTLGAILTVVASVVGEDWAYIKWIQGGILVCTIIATIVIPNPVQPVTVVQAPA